MTEKQKVLVVDDEPRNQRIIIEVLEDWVETKVASSGEEALACLETYAPDLVLLDIMMPGKDGYEVCKAIRSNPKLVLTKVILVSGKAMVDERLKGYEVGADDYMTKPFVSDELLAKAKVFLRLSLAERNLSNLNASLDETVKERTKQLIDAEAKMINNAKMSALGEMAGGIAHEINTPLGTIAMIAEQLQELVEEDPMDRKTVKEMSRIAGVTVKKISTIIHGLRTFSRDGSADRFDSSSLKEIVENTLTLCRERLKSVNVKMEVDDIPETLKVQCRPVQILQVLLNLISNACDAIENLPEKWIKISIQKNGDLVQISVTDSGGGISEEVKNKLFHPFFTTKDIGKGTGLGLSISKGIMDAHHGSLSVDGQCSNTRFVITLPEGAV